MNDSGSGIGDLAPARSGAAAVPLEAQHVGFDYSGQIVLRDLSLRLPAQRLTALVGPNGSGKSTLMSTLARLHAPSAGRIVLDGRDIGSYPTKEVARRMAILPQTPIVPEAITVFDLVSRGRYPHQTTFRRWTEADTAAVERAIPGVRPCPFGHMGDGNIHFNFSQPVGADPKAFMAREQDANAAVYEVVARLGGSVSAEHGIGQLKAALLRQVKDPVALEMMRAIKAALDPNGILNPGKLLG